MYSDNELLYLSVISDKLTVAIVFSKNLILQSLFCFILPIFAKGIL